MMKNNAIIFSQPPPPGGGLPDTKRDLSFTTTTDCSNLPVPDNTKPPFLQLDATGNPMDDGNRFLGCIRPRKTSEWSKIISMIEFKTIPPFTGYGQLNFHFFCGELHLKAHTSSLRSESGQVQGNKLKS